MSHVVVGIKEVEAATPALTWAAHYAQAHAAELVLIHVVDDAALLAGEPALMDDAHAYAQRALAEGEQIARAAGASNVSTTVVTGGAVDELIDAAAGADLLVVTADNAGTARRRGVHALRIAASHSAPVAVIPDIDLKDRRGVVVGVDGSEQAARALEYAAQYAAASGAELHAVFAWELPFVSGFEYSYPAEYVREQEQTAQAVLANLVAPIRAAHPSLTVHELVAQGDPVDAILETAQNAALVVIGTHGRSAMSRLLLGSVSHGVLAHLPAPTIVVR